jgi:GTP-binding protein HflX
LDEVRESDLLLHVVDISNPSFESQIEVVNHTLFEIGVSEKPIILVFNKIDSFTFIEKESNDLTPKTKRNISLEDLKKTWPSRMQRNTIFISALHRTYFDELKKLLYKKVKRLHIKRYPYYNFLY